MVRSKIHRGRKDLSAVFEMTQVDAFACRTMGALHTKIFLLVEP